MINFLGTVISIGGHPIRTRENEMTDFPPLASPASYYEGYRSPGSDPDGIQQWEVRGGVWERVA